MIRFIAAFVLFCVLAPGSADAEPWPEYQSVYVNDFADALDAETEAALTGYLTALRADHGVEMTVVTIGTIRDYDRSHSWEDFATRLFNGWGIGDPDRNDGVLFLFAMEDRNMRLEIGAGYHTDWDRAAEQIVQYIMVPNFKKGDVNGGVTAGVRTMIARITTNIANGRPATASPFENPIAQSAPTEQFRLVGQDDGASPGGTLDWLWYSLVVPVLGGGALFTRRIYRM